MAKKPHILILGGHVTPAYAVIEELLSRGHSKISFVGRKYSDRKQTDISFEYKEITSLNIPFYNLISGRVSRIISWDALFDCIALFFGFMQGLFYIFRLKPTVIVSFGGYLAVPVSIVAKIFGIPVITHEQTISPGIANRFIGFFANKVLVSFPSTVSFFKKEKTELTGNPVRKSLSQKGQQLFEPTRDPIVFITGGGLGSHSINLLIEEILGELTSHFVVIHQIGNVSEFGDYIRLYPQSSPRYYPYESLTAEQMAWAYHQADIVLSRAGANTTFELIMLKKPAVLIPLPWSGNDEQQLQADFFARNGFGESFSQKNSSKELFDLIEKVYKNIDAYKKAFLSTTQTFPTNASEHIADIIEACAGM